MMYQYAVFGRQGYPCMVPKCTQQLGIQLSYGSGVGSVAGLYALTLGKTVHSIILATFVW